MQTDLFKPLRSVRGGDVFGFKPEVVLLVCIVVSWYCFKGRMYGVVGGAGLDYRLIDSWAFSAGGIAGSLWFLMRKDDERTRCAPLSWWPWVVACIAAVVGSAVAWAGGATTIALIARFCISVCITVLFLRVCILFIYQPFYVVVYAFLIIAIARICQCVVDWVTLQPVYSTLIQYLIGCVVLVAVFLVSSNLNLQIKCNTSE